MILIEVMANSEPTRKCHDNEDVLAHYVIRNLKWRIQKIGNKWDGNGYEVILEQVGCGLPDERNLV